MLAIYERAAGHAVPGRALSLGAAVFAVVAVVAFDIGMVGWMLVLHFNDLMPGASEGSFWFQMQIGVVVGLATGYPAVKWLRSRQETVVVA